MSGQWPKPGWSLLSNRSGTTVSAGKRVVEVDPETVPDGSAAAVVASLEASGGNERAPDAIRPAAVDGAAPATPGERAIAQTAVARTEGSEFLAKLARAMHTTAARERTTIADDAERRRQAQVQTIRERAASEVERIRELAGEDMKAIETWAEGEANRIKLERDQRVKALNEDLELSLTEHGAKIDAEVKAAETAIAAYRTTADAFFADLDHEIDPVVIARQAAARYPVFPMLAETARTLSGSADASPAMVGVMSQPPAGGSLGSATASAAGSPILVAAAGSETITGPVEARAPAEALVGASNSGAGQDASPLQALLSARSDGRPRPEANGTDRDSQS